MDRGDIGQFTAERGRADVGKADNGWTMDGGEEGMDTWEGK